MQRKINVTKFERNNIPLFRVYSGKGRTEINFNDLAAKTFKINIKDKLIVDYDKQMFTVLRKNQELKGEKGFYFSRSVKPNIYFRTHTSHKLRSGIYAIDLNVVRVANVNWVKFKWVEPLQSRKTYDIKTPEKNVSGAKEIFNFVVNKYETLGDTKYMITIKLKDGYKIGMRKDKRLVINPELNGLAVAQRPTDLDSDFIPYKSYVIKKQDNVFKIVNIHKKAFKKTGVYTLTADNKFENNQKFFTFYLNKEITKEENSVRRSRKNKEDLLQDRPTEKDSFKYDERPRVKMYIAKNKKQKQMVVLFNYELAKRVGIKDDHYIRFVKPTVIIHSTKRKKEGKWYKINKVNNEFETRVNLQKVKLTEGDYKAKVSGKTIKLSKGIKENLNHLKSFDNFIS